MLPSHAIGRTPLKSYLLLGNSENNFDTRVGRAIDLEHGGGDNNCCCQCYFQHNYITCLVAKGVYL